MIRWYGNRIAISSAALIFIYLLTPTASLILSTILHIIQVIFPTLCGLILIKNPKYLGFSRSQAALFSVFFLILGLSDMGYYLFLYLWKSPTKSSFVSLITTVPYYIAYVFACIGLRVSIRNFKTIWTQKEFWAFPVLSVLMSIPFVFLPTWKTFTIGQIQAYQIIEFVVSLMALVLMNLAFYVMVCSRNLNWSIFSTGFFSLSVSDWAIQVESLNRTHSVVSFNGFLWTFSGILVSLPIINRNSKFSEFVDPFEKSSLLSTVRLNLIIALVLPLGFLAQTLNASWYGVVLISFGFVFGAVSVVLIGEYLSEKITLLGTIISRLSSNEVNLKNFSESSSRLPLELKEQILAAFSRKLIEEDEKTQQIMASSREIANISAQVSHDIRSPIAALDICLQNPSISHDEIRSVGKLAVNRIKDIANTLWERHNQAIADAANQSLFKSRNNQNLMPTILSTIIDEIIAEKVPQLSKDTRLKVTHDSSNESRNLSARIIPSELKRILSNLITNSIESLGQADGKIGLILSDSKNEICLQVRDNGKGIPKTLLPTLGQRGLSYGKSKMKGSGTGLGLYHAKKSVTNWGGRLSIESEVNIGTSVSIFLPKPEKPYFISTLSVSRNSNLIIYDQDTKCHQTWKTLFETLGLSNYGIILSCYSALDQKNFSENIYSQKNSLDTYLIDNNLGVDISFGISLLSTFESLDNVFLLVDAETKPNVFFEAEQRGIGLINKALISEIQLVVTGDDSTKLGKVLPNAKGRII